MSSYTSLPRNRFSSDDSKLYKSLGSLIKEYRQWKNLSQEKLSESIRISVRALQNWEADDRRVRVDNLHDLSEFTKIPMQVLVALNADQPIWYSLRKRLFMYSLFEKEQCSSCKLFGFNENPEDYTLIETVPITTDKQINMILSCHSDIYGTKKSLRKDVIKSAIKIIPNLNIIIYDYWGQYVGHRITLPFKMGIYEAIKTQKSIEDYLTVQMISDIIALGEGVFLNYSTFVTNIITSSQLAKATLTLSKIKRKERYVLVSHTVTKESELFMKNLGMTFVMDYAHLGNEVCPVLYETKLDYQLRPDGPFGWMVKPTATKELTNTIIIESRQSSSTISIQNPDKSSNQGESAASAKKSESTLPSTVDKKKREIQDCKRQYINSTIEACKNPKCTLFGKTGKSNIVSNGTYLTNGGIIGYRFLCKECGKSFCRRTGTIFYNIRSPEKKVLESLKLLAKEIPLQQVAKHMGVKFDTVRRWLKVATQQKDKINSILINDPDISSTELDALWEFVNTNSLRRRALICRKRNKSFTN